MSEKANEMKEDGKKNETCSENNEKGKKMNIKKLVKYGDGKKRCIHKKGIFNKVISKKTINTMNISSFAITATQHPTRNEEKKNDEVTNVDSDITSKNIEVKKITMLNDEDSFLFKVPHVEKKNTVVRSNQTFMRRRIDSISNSSLLTSQVTSGSSQGILKQIAAKAAKARLQRIRNNPSLSENGLVVQKHQEVIVKDFDAFLPYSKGDSSNGQIEPEIKEMES